MTIEDIFTKHPQKGQRLAQEMTNAGLHCVGCQAATWETLEVGMLGHGFQEGDIKTLIDRLNEILAEELDSSTISLTKRAAEKFKTILREEKKEGWSLRFADKPGGCGGFEYLLDFSEMAKEFEESAKELANGPLPDEEPLQQENVTQGKQPDERNPTPSTKKKMV